MNASLPAAAAASVGPVAAAATGFWLQRDATRHHPGGRQTSGRATAAETRVARWVNAGAGPTRLHLWCARSRDRLSANHLSKICIRTRLGSPVLIGIGVQASAASRDLASATGARSDSTRGLAGVLLSGAASAVSIHSAMAEATADSVRR